MDDQRSRLGDEMERAINRAALERNAVYVVIVLGLAYLLMRAVM